MPQSSITKYYSVKRRVNNNSSFKDGKSDVVSSFGKSFIEKTANPKEKVVKSELKSGCNSSETHLSNSTNKNVQQGEVSPKRTHPSDEDITVCKRRRRDEAGNSISNDKMLHSARKKLDLDSICEKKQADKTKNKDSIDDMLTLSTPELPRLISPLPLTPENKKGMSQVIGSDKLSPSEMKKRLQKCGRLAELQERLAKVNNCSQKLKELRALHPYSPKKQSPTKSPAKISPLGSPRKVNARFSPVKRQLMFPSKHESVESPSTVPAYQRFHNLAAPPSSSLPLPFRYRLLAEFFRCVETVVSMLHNRHEICTFSKIKKAVEEIMRKTFNLTKLAQIKTAFPLAYFFKQEKNDKCFDTQSKSNYDLTVMPNLNNQFDDIKLSSDYVETVTKEETVPDIPSCSIDGNITVQMNASCLLFRRNVFQHNLLEIVRRHHDAFLKSLDPPISIPHDKLTVWHPSFKLDQIPDVPSAMLPLPPTVKTYDTAKDVLSKAICVSGSDTKVEKALQKVIDQTSNKDVPQSSKKCDNQTKPAQNNALKGISQSLLQKIRAKEAAKIAEKMQRNPEEDANKVMIERFPDFIRIIRTYFISEKKIALPIDDVIKKLSESYQSSLSSVDIDKHLKLLSSSFPSWLMILTLKKGVFIKIDKNRNLADLYEKVEKLKN